ncbi:polysaccharide ABC transporter ATP-binding protein [uncultured Psychroserpens sp.]|uniref:ABC transporter ATP-binding protein n=1 Tax=uncultured Psychroserpens sp. TaxID=255436 RepID=UPI0026172455|nr:polysaccharide ABC transporter ATP-binding protein [uncultured Psychroserpens sp.]
MSNIILKAENISKQYRLGLVGTGTIADDLKRWCYKLLGKEDPFLKIGEANDRSSNSSANYVWALQNINFEVNKGDVLGIIGKNGAGKSTLLKLLSRVTSPTTGEIKTKGRIASLLEVGTGFHPELTGRENIYLNGAILGMTKSEISKKEEEIIEFSGCLGYIDTPVKRYSSGMRVRLAFAVAAHLEPDILVVDEVLAVGDAEFQKKAIGKMQDISRGDGRTVLFVSHNMAAVRNLCTRAIVLEHGETVFEGSTDEAVDYYLQKENSKLSSTGIYTHKEEDLQNGFSLKSVKLFNSNNENQSLFLSDEYITVVVEYVLDKTFNDIRINLKVLSKNEDIIVFTTSSHSSDETDKKAGNYRTSVRLPKDFFNKGQFKIAINAGVPGIEVLFPSSYVLDFQIEKLTPSGSITNTVFPGITAPNLEWNVTKLAHDK